MTEAESLEDGKLSIDSKAFVDSEHREGGWNNSRKKNRRMEVSLGLRGQREVRRMGTWAGWLGGGV
jgi:hypothetical protein